MSIVDTISSLQQTTGVTQKKTAADLHIDQSYLSRILKGERKWPDHLDSNAAKMNWRIALAVIEERTGGWIKNRFGDVDPHPSALKEQLMMEFGEAMQALGEMILGNHIDRKKQQEKARKAVKELKEAVEVGAIMIGTIEEVFELKGEKK